MLHVMNFIKYLHICVMELCKWSPLGPVNIWGGALALVSEHAPPFTQFWVQWPSWDSVSLSMVKGQIRISSCCILKTVSKCSRSMLFLLNIYYITILNFVNIFFRESMMARAGLGQCWVPELNLVIPFEPLLLLPQVCIRKKLEWGIGAEYRTRVLQNGLQASYRGFIPMLSVHPHVTLKECEGEAEKVHFAIHRGQHNWKELSP